MVVANKYEIAQTAYVKIVLHALKHQCSAVNGVLIGKVTGLTDVNESSEVSSKIEIVDAVPLFHGQLGLLPMLELALSQTLEMLREDFQRGLRKTMLRLTSDSAEEMEMSPSIQVEEHLATNQEGLVIAGYYHANERFDDYELGLLARRIGDHIARFCPQAGLLLLDNRLLGSLQKGANKKPVVQLFTRDAVRGWRQSGDLSLKEPTANSILSDYVSEKREQHLVDFDDHLNDISKGITEARALFNSIQFYVNDKLSHAIMIPSLDVEDIIPVCNQGLVEP